MSKLLKVIVNIFLLFAIAVAAAILVPPLLGVSTVVVDSASMETNLPMGSVTYAEMVDVNEVQAGDRVLVDTDVQTYAYQVESGDVTTGAYQVRDVYDSGATSTEVTLRNTVSKILITIPFIGYIMIAMHSMEGLIIIGLIVLFVIILFILSELWKKNDDDEDEDEDLLDTAMPAQAVAAATEPAVAAVPVGPAVGDMDEMQKELAAAVADIGDSSQVEGEQDPNVDDEVARQEAKALAEAMAAETGNGFARPADDHKDAKDSATEPAGTTAQAAETQATTDGNNEGNIIEGTGANVVAGESLETLSQGTAAADTEGNTEAVETAVEEPEVPEQQEEPEDTDSFIPVERPGLEELLAKAKEAGEEPEIIKDEDAKVSILDYSKLI